MLEWILNEDSWKRPTANDALHDEWFSLWKSDLDDSVMLGAEDSLNKLKTYSKRNELLKAVMLYLAMRSETEDNNLRQMFDLADSDNDGSISKPELIDGIQSINN